ncbi:MAG: response regulator transcription factor [Blastocatellia bacterium]|nr:response regulator transcription factor [Blastocatellia bacterium]
MERIRVVLISDLEIARESLALLIASHPNFELVGVFADSGPAIARSAELGARVHLFQVGQFSEAVRQDLNLLQLGIEELALVILAGEIQMDLLQELKKSNSSAYVMHDSSVGLLYRAIESTARGSKYLDSRIAEFMLSNMVYARPQAGASAERQLSKREEEVLRLVAQGHTMNQIAAMLGLSVKTVDTHKARAKLKIGVSDKASIVRYAIAQGWMEQYPPPGLLRDLEPARP